MAAIATPPTTDPAMIPLTGRGEGLAVLVVVEEDVEIDVEADVEADVETEGPVLMISYT